jgi:excisionase family DNA binding protein
MEINHIEFERLCDRIAAQVIESLSTGLGFDRWLTVEEAQAYTKQRSRNTIKRWIDAGHIYAKKTTGKTLIDRESIDQYLLSDL